MVSLFDKENKMKNNCNKVRQKKLEKMRSWLIIYVLIHCPTADVDQPSGVSDKDQEVAVLWTLESEPYDVSSSSVTCLENLQRNTPELFSQHSRHGCDFSSAPTNTLLNDSYAHLSGKTKQAGSSFSADCESIWAFSRYFGESIKFVLISVTFDLADYLADGVNKVLLRLRWNWSVCKCLGWGRTSWCRTIEATGNFFSERDTMEDPGQSKWVLWEAEDCWAATGDEGRLVSRLVYLHGAGVDAADIWNRQTYP